MSLLSLHGRRRQRAVPDVAWLRLTGGVRCCPELARGHADVPRGVVAGVCITRRRNAIQGVSLLVRRQRERALAVDIEILDNDAAAPPIRPDPEGDSAQSASIFSRRLVEKYIA